MKAGVFNATVHHKRFLPKINKFSYSAYYVILDMDQLKPSPLIFSINKANIISYYDKDHGLRDNTSATAWAKCIFAKYHTLVERLFLLTMPRVYGYLFNPVSFWFGFKDNNLIGVIAEVNNTFKQSHCYICIPSSSATIKNETWFSAPKVFHVSPFYERVGEYRFNFQRDHSGKIRIFIYYYHDKKIQLVTSLTGQTCPLHSSNLIKSMIKVPLLTAKVTCLIHYQALKLWLKKIKYQHLPQQKATTVTLATEETTNTQTPHEGIHHV